MQNKKLRIAYSGAPGAYAETAAKLIYKDCEAVPYADFGAAYAAVGECDAAVLPLENSYAGDVAQVIDLAFGGSLNIIKVCEMEINHCLLGLRGADIEDITDVISHPQALWQSAGFISKHGFSVHEAANTALAAEQTAKSGKKEMGVIASKNAATLYNLDVLAENINESSTNTTRFAVFSRDMPASGSRFIMFFTVGSQAGSLGRAVAVISGHGINMRALKSRPTRTSNWEYYFYVECDGDVSSKEVQDMLKDLRAVCLNLKIAGVY